MCDDNFAMGEPEECETLFAKSVPQQLSSDLSRPISSEHQQLTQSQQYKAGWSCYLVLAGVVTTLGLSLPVGYNIGVVNTPAEVIKKFCNETVSTRYDAALSEAWLNVLWASVVSAFIVGGCTGSVMGAVMANKLGRKYASVATAVLFVAGSLNFVLCRAANSVEMLLLGRLLVGLASGLTTSIVPMYLTELAPLHLTGAMGVACPMGVNVGVLVGQVMGLDFLLGGVDDWPYLLAVYAVLVIICLPLLVILPESPKYLYVVKRNEAVASKELSRLRGVSASVLTAELELLGTESAGEGGGEGGEGYSMVGVLRDPRLRLPLILCCAMQAGQQTSGINAVFYYSQTIFLQAGLTDTQAQYATIGCGFINVCTAVLMLRLLPQFGRRPLLLGSVLSSTVLLALLAASIKFLDAVSWMPFVCMVAVLSYVLVYGFGLGPIPYFIASELFEVGPRPAGMAWGSLANWGGNLLVGMCFPSMRALLGPYSFLVFSAVTAALFVLLKLYFPETQGKTPAQVAQIFSRRKLTPSSDPLRNNA
ncbi:solute carrier family 2, facilitated glucose transporter member 5 isoform X1 [Plutella xylostella]|uniref:solute carrier family 2, facilitated glucose transporter member 5 isoform X1 n=1 Tax=Plutella xylostella TaxID=51655 RepID=UPI002032D722|nr:solute carrier family 2, facilitated glucose transporter member 5 isoform X1 [Plutella xylostella]